MLRLAARGIDKLLNAKKPKVGKIHLPTAINLGSMGCCLKMFSLHMRLHHSHFESSKLKAIEKELNPWECHFVAALTCWH